MASRKAQALIKAARTGDAAARLQLGRLYLSGGEGLAASPQAAFHWLAQADCSIDAAREIAACIPPEAASADPATYARACRRAADSGSAVAHRTLGELLLEGRGVPADPMAAQEAFRLAAEAGDLAAAARLGELLAAQPDSTVEARLWLERAATHGNMAAGRRLADLLWRAGDEAAAPWLRTAAQAGDMEAACRLGELLADCEGEAGREGMAWLERAARQGHARALWLYGRRHAGNLGGGGGEACRPATLAEAGSAAAGTGGRGGCCRSLVGPGAALWPAGVFRARSGPRPSMPGGGGADGRAGGPVVARRTACRAQGGAEVHAGGRPLVGPCCRSG